MRALLGPRRTPAGAVVAILILLCPPAASRAGAQTSEADVFVAQAVVDFDDKRYDDALANLRRALEIQPDHVEALYYTGVVEMARRSEEHTSELQSLAYLVCRLLLEKKKKN